jgi:hypothetical protein
MTQVMNVPHIPPLSVHSDDVYLQAQSFQTWQQPELNGAWQPQIAQIWAGLGTKACGERSAQFNRDRWVGVVKTEALACQSNAPPSTMAPPIVVPARYIWWLNG